MSRDNIYIKNNILRSKEFDQVLSKNPPKLYKIILYSILLLSSLLLLSLFLVRYPEHFQAMVKIEKNVDVSTSYYLIVSAEEINNISDNKIYEIMVDDINNHVKKHNVFTICDSKEHWFFQEGKWSIPICGDLSNIMTTQGELEQKTCVITLYTPLFYIIF